MTKFNPENKETLTYGEALSPAMDITDIEDAKQYFDAYVCYTQKFITEKSEKTAEEICRANIGYFAGYYNDETATRVKTLFNASHPIFGDSRPTIKEAFEAGKKLASS